MLPFNQIYLFSATLCQSYFHPPTHPPNLAPGEFYPYFCSMQKKDLCTWLKKALKEPLPGTEVQWEMASSDRRIKNFPRKASPGSKPAAVLLLLYPLNETVHIVLIQRPLYNGVHSGQISFPVGKMEEKDSDLTATALREACEETGFCSNNTEILGTLTPLYIPVSDFIVWPFGAWTAKRPSFSPNREVVDLIEVPLEFFSDSSSIKEKPMKIRDELLDVRYYDYNGSVIWGATAMILHELTVILEKR